jgi:hypothetical protein
MDFTPDELEAIDFFARNGRSERHANALRAMIQRLGLVIPPPVPRHGMVATHVPEPPRTIWYWLLWRWL